MHIVDDAAAVEKNDSTTMKGKKLPGENENYEDELTAVLSEYRRSPFSFDDDLRRLNYQASIDLVVPNRYCACGYPHSVYHKENHRLAHFEFIKSSYNDYHHQFYDVDKLTAEVLDSDRNSVSLTKHSLMLNQFLELAADTEASAPPSITSPAVADDANRFGSVASPAVDRCRGTVVSMRENKHAHGTLCLPSPSILSDKRLVSLFRSVALYWFFCLNTVLVKSELFKRKPLLAYDSGSSSRLTAEMLRFCASPIALHGCFGEGCATATDDYFWHMITDVLLRDEDKQKPSSDGCGPLLTYADHSKQRHRLRLLQQILLSLMDAAGTSLPASMPPNLHGWINLSGHAPVKRASLVDAAAEPVRKRGKLNEELAEMANDSPSTSAVVEPAVGANRTDDVDRECEEDEPRDAAVVDETDEDHMIFEKYWIDLEKYLDEWKNEEADGGDRCRTDDASTQTEPEIESNCSSPGASSLYDQNCYFLPEGIFNVDETEYPQYNLWCSPLIIEEVLCQSGSLESATTARRNKNDGAAAADAAAFKPYRLWESSSAPEDDQIPKEFCFNGGHGGGDDDDQEGFSVFSIPYYPAGEPTKRHESKKAAAMSVAAAPSVYSLWGSPNIIDFLPSIGCLSFVNNLNRHDQHSLTTSSSSLSSAESVDLEYVGESPTASLRSQRSHDGYFSRSKFLTFKPVVNGFVSFTDRGAFEYYKKPVTQTVGDSCAGDQTKPDGDTGLTIVYEKQIPPYAEPKPVTDDAADNEVNKINEVDNDNIAGGYETEAPAKDDASDTACFFRPIQPAFKVETDAQPALERSLSGTYYLQERRRFFTFKHEIVTCPPADVFAFEPKYEVLANDKACQTDSYVYSPGRQFGMRYDHGMYLYQRPAAASSSTSTSSNLLKNHPLPEATAAALVGNSFPNAAFFYSLEEVFNYLGKSSLAGMDVKTSAEFGCLF